MGLFFDFPTKAILCASNFCSRSITQSLCGCITQMLHCKVYVYEQKMAFGEETAEEPLIKLMDTFLSQERFNHFSRVEALIVKS